MSSLPLFQTRDDLASEKVWTVSELTGRVRAVFEDEFASVGVIGEVSNLSRARSGHVYFSLKDESAQLRAVLWKGAAQRLVFDLENGLAVRAWGAVEVYAPRGEYQLIVRKIEPEGIGALELAFRQVVARLSAEGLFDPGRKRPLPTFPRRIVVVTSPTGAAVRDFVQTAARRWPSAEILIAPTRVQGPGSAEEVAGAIALANRIRDVDFLVLARGGGSLEDLWTFNEEVVARAIFDSKVPVVSAIGHEVDVTVADLVADFRALTPTDAGSRCVPDAAEVLALLLSYRDRLARGVAEPSRRARRDVQSLGDRLKRGMALGLDRRRQSLARRAAQVEALSPLNVLARGYSLTLKEDGSTVVRSADEVQDGDLIRTRLASGTITSRVESANPPTAKDTAHGP